MIIGRQQAGDTIRLSVGQTVVVKPPLETVEWTVDYAPEVLSALTPPEKMSAPGPEGWLFEARAPGETDLTLTSRAIAGPPARFSVTIRVHQPAFR
jgi:hypothetical protein